MTLAVITDLIDRYKWLLIVAGLTALVYQLGDTVVRGLAVLQPSVKVITVTKVVKQSNVHEIVREVVRPDGTSERTTERTDRSVESNTATADRETHPEVPGRTWGVTVWTGGGRALTGEYLGMIGGSYGPVLVTVDCPVTSLEPRLTAAYGWHF
jgi:hypothetical protein